MNNVVHLILKEFKMENPELSLETMHYHLGGNAYSQEALFTTDKLKPAMKKLGFKIYPCFWREAVGYDDLNRSIFYMGGASDVHLAYCKLAAGRLLVAHSINDTMVNVKVYESVCKFISVSKTNYTKSIFFNECNILNKCAHKLTIPFNNINDLEIYAKTKFPALEKDIDMIIQDFLAADTK